MNRLEQMLEFLEQDPNDSFARYAVALEYRSAGDLPAAIAQLEELRQRDPMYLACYYQLGGALAEAERYDDAEHAYQQGIELARQRGDIKTLSELQDACDELETMR